MKKGTLQHDTTNPKGVKSGSAPFSTSWGNSRPLASSKAAHEAPGGVLSPMELNGTGKKGRK